jgi:hypothetical protein
VLLRLKRVFLRLGAKYCRTAEQIAGAEDHDCAGEVYIFRARRQQKACRSSHVKLVDGDYNLRMGSTAHDFEGPRREPDIRLVIRLMCKYPVSAFNECTRG